MDKRNNFLLGYGERLKRDIASPTGGGEKKHPYTFQESRDILAPKIREASEDLDSLPASICPRDRAVALLTLHPTYLAKTYYPAELLGAFGLDTVGSRPREIAPRKWATKRHPEYARTSELYVAGSRSDFRQLAEGVAEMSRSATGAGDLLKLEDFRTQPITEKLKPLRSQDTEPLLEVVLHAQPTSRDAYIIDGFEAYLNTLGLKPNLDERRFFAEGLCFLPLRVPRDIALEVAKYSFLRLAREMPRLRQFRPVVRMASGFTPFDCRLPVEDSMDRDIRVAIFDGGIKSNTGLDRWVSHKEIPNATAPVLEFQAHGTAVTSALLFGPLENGTPPLRPYVNIDHYRVLDDDTASDDQNELYHVLERIQGVLESRAKYDFVNLSIGPDLPIEDTDVHAWTAVLDQLFSDGQTLATIAVGNSGEQDWSSGNARIQTPADCVNALSVGGCDRTGEGWKRAPYSSIGPGRSPGIMKPDGLAFGGSSREPYWVLNADNPGAAIPVAGTSFAAPTALRTAIGLRTHFGNVLKPLAIKALLLHHAEDGGYDVAEVGWGRLPTEVGDIALTDEHSAHVLYQGELRPASWVRIQIPIPSLPMSGMVRIAATFCFATPTDPQDPLNYTRSGLEVRFRPHSLKRKKPGQVHADSSPFFQARDVWAEEAELRADAHKWETTLHKTRRVRSSGLYDPVFDVHYNARIGGRNATGAEKIPYALVVTIESNKTPNLYSRILQRYQTVLEPLRPVLEIPVRT